MRRYLVRSFAERSMTPFEDLVFIGIMILRDGPFFLSTKWTLDLSTIIIIIIIAHGDFVPLLSFLPF